MQSFSEIGDKKILSSVQFSSLHFTSLTINFASVVLRILVVSINIASVQGSTYQDDEAEGGRSVSASPLGISALRGVVGTP